jgi:hypothetical protein
VTVGFKDVRRLALHKQREQAIRPSCKDWLVSEVLPQLLLETTLGKCLGTPTGSLVGALLAFAVHLVGRSFEICTSYLHVLSEKMLQVFSETTWGLPVVESKKDDLIQTKPHEMLLFLFSDPLSVTTEAS